ncbi:MAG: hypothetical protein IPK16_27550 [Anaerolineales bacterium]|nr:hypothetical protein [Anaerolineales bacterium]
MMPETEHLLSGGNVNIGVVRIGATVRRGQTAASPAVHQLLRHLEARGFDGCPRFLGTDEQGREVLSYIEGSTDIPLAIWRADGPLLAAALAAPVSRRDGGLRGAGSPGLGLLLSRCPAP